MKKMRTFVMPSGQRKGSALPCESLEVTDEEERSRGGNRHFERALPALPLDRAAGGEQRRGPDSHQAGPQGHVEQGFTSGSRLEHEEGDGREDDRLDRRRQDEKARQGEALQVKPPAREDQPQRLHARSRVARLRLWPSTSRR